MKKQALIFLFIISTCCVLPSSAYAQLDVTTQLTTKHIIPPFVSDGQTYRAMVLSGQNAEFHATFFSGTTYRIAAASGSTDGNLLFSIYSYQANTGERQLIFTNAAHQNAPFWDFKVNATVEIILEAKLNPSAGKDSGFAILALGFKQ